MIFLRALLPLVPHIVIAGGLAALYHIVSESHYSLTDLVRNALLGFSWHAVAQIAVALPFLGVFYLCARFLVMWRRRKVRKLLRQFEDE